MSTEAMRIEMDQQRQINVLLRKELAIYKERSDLMRDLVLYAYKCSSAALMMDPAKPREGRKAREQALCDINKKLGGYLR